MRRKVIQIADSTQLISLPRKWALSHNIKKGDELDIIEKESQLIIQTPKSKNSSNITVEIQNLDRDSIMFLIRALYKNGYDEITIKFENSLCDNFRTKEKMKIIDVIRSEISRLNGVELFTQKENYCVIRNISEDTTRAFDSMLKRLFMLASETMQDLIEGYERNDAALLETIQKKHDVVTKFTVYCQRLLNKIEDSQFKRNELVFHILEIIDTIMDLLKYNSRKILKDKVKASAKSVKVCKAIHKSFNMYVELFYNFDMEKIYELNKNRYSVLRELSELQNKIHKDEFSIISNMSQILEYVLGLTNSSIALNY
ncbi:AbrB/MazE/SpoVT family DNA-binding domain-containing protein [Candidatus Woesearchaeota archaeon]|nr:AbrB/MazE/SpoVT family DNA-binding domain-containing protein [Candidatus Woesearchaeota archaeon]MBW3015983.1 AbrB/MazE/SpoVT family DNA-binding domain-containing protein [Candidatus Woesearchaeota archaeon]